VLKVTIYTRSGREYKDMEYDSDYDGFVHALLNKYRILVKILEKSKKLKIF